MIIALLAAPLQARADGYVVAWGSSYYGDITPPPGLSGVVAIAAGGFHCLALKSDGTVVGWGSNYQGELSIPSGLSGVVAIATGEEHSLALKSDGTVVGWGDNNYGQATPPPNLTGVVAIAAGIGHSLALRRDGTVVAWGANYYGQSNPPAGLSGVVAIAAGYASSLALRSDGTVIGWGLRGVGGNPDPTTPPPGLTGVIAIAAGRGYSLALKSNGTVVAWGWNYRGDLTAPAGLSGAVAIATGGDPSWTTGQTVALKRDGTVVEWGEIGMFEDDLLPFGHHAPDTPPTGLSGVVAVAAGYGRSLALVQSDTTPPVVMRRDYGRSADGHATAKLTVRDLVSGLKSLQVLQTTQAHVDLPSFVEGVQSPVSLQVTLLQSGTGSATIRATDMAGNVHDETVGLTDADGDGYPDAVDCNDHDPAVNPGQLEVPHNGQDDDCNSGSSDGGPNWAGGYVVGWGEWDQAGETTPPVDLDRVIAVAAGGLHSLALKSNGTVVGWGSNDYGQTTPPPGLSGVVAIAAGWRHSLALRYDGTVVGWGFNGDGEATPPPGLSGVVAIAAGSYHSLALKNNGTVVGWGWNMDGNGAYSGQATPPAGLSGVAAIAAGSRHSVALKNDGTVVAWGSSRLFGDITPPPGLSHIVAIAAGESYSLALKSDGTVVGWGERVTAQSPPVGLSGVVAIAAGESYSLALKGDGTVVAWGSDTPPPGLSNVVAISAAAFHSLALVSPDAPPDTTPPVLTLPADPTVTAPDLSGAVVSFVASAFDARDGSVPVTCVPASGTRFPIGTTPVGCSAEDHAGNTATGSFRVIVMTPDVTPPVLTLPADRTVTASGPSGAVVTFSATATDDRDGSVPVTCTPPSGSLFPVGTTTVACSAVDRAGNPASGSFRITVNPAPTASFAFWVPGQPQSTLTLRQGDPPVLAFHLVGQNGYIRDGQTPLSSLKGCGTLLSVQVVGGQVVVRATNGTYVSRDGFLYTRTS